MSATTELLARDHHLKVVPFGSGKYHQFSNDLHLDIQDPTGIACEEGELLYGLVRMTQPTLILETGTNIGISTCYMALACEHNGKGKILTIEHDGYVATRAAGDFGRRGLTKWIAQYVCEVDDFSCDEGEFDFMWLDSELRQRYGELVRFYPQLAYGGIACIHDLWTLDFPEFGGVSPQLKGMLARGDLRVLTFKADHGVTVFQKRSHKDAASDIIGEGRE